MKPLSLYLVFTCFNPDMVLDFPPLLHAFTDLKSVFLDFVCRKGIPFTKGKSMASSTCLWCLSMIVGKGILGMVLWCSGILMIALPCMVVIWGPYMASAMLISSVVIVKLLIWFFLMAYFKVYVDSHRTSFCSILDFYGPSIYFM